MSNYQISDAVTSSLSEKYKPSSSFVIFDPTVAEALH